MITIPDIMRGQLTGDQTQVPNEEKGAFQGLLDDYQQKGFGKTWPPVCKN